MSERPETNFDDLARHAAFLRRVAARLAGAGDADDLAQDAFLIGMRERSRRGDPPRAWWVRVIRNLFVDRLRSEKRRSAHELQAMPNAESIDPRLESEHRELLAALTRAMCALSSEQYRVVRMRWFDGRSPTEIAALTGEPLATVKRRLERALAAMRERLGHEKPDWRAALPIFLGSAAPAGIGSAWAAWKGACAAMAVQKKFGVAAAVIVIGLGVGAFALLDRSGGEDESIVDVATELSAKIVEEPRRAAESPATTAPTATVPTLPTDDEFFAKVDRDLDIFGRVVDASSQPIAGATVRSLAYPWRRVSVLNRVGYDEARLVESASTDPLGRFILRHRRGDVVDLEVFAQGFERRTFAQKQAGEKCVLTLDRPLPFRVAVVDESDRPVEGAALHVWRMIEGRDARSRTTHDRRGKTGANGELAIDDVSAGPLIVNVDHPFLSGADWTPFVLKEPGQRIVVTLKAGTRFDGRVVDAQTGFGIAGAKVGDGWNDLTSTMTDDAGRFSISLHVGDSPNLLRAAHPQYAERLEGLPKGGREIVIALSKCQSVVGRVVDVGGAPISGAFVSAIAEFDLGVLGAADAHSATTAADGTFKIDGLRPDLMHSYVVQASGFGRDVFDPWPNPDGDGRRTVGDLVLEKGVSIEGRVVAADGRPAADIAVRLDGSFAEATKRARTGGRPGVSDYGRTEERRTDDLGRFRFPDLSSGEYTLTVGQIDGLPVKRNVTWKRGETPEFVEIRFENEAPLQVIVIDDADQPVAGLPVSVTVDGRGSQEKRTGADGGASFSGVDPGRTFHLSLELAGRPYLGQAYREMKRTDDRVTVRLERAAVISGRVEKEDGTGAAGYIVTAQFDGEETGATSDHDGKFRVNARTGKTAQIRCDGERVNSSFDIEHSTMRGGPVEVVAPRDHVRLIVRELTADKTLTIVVRDAEGRPSANAQIFLSVAGVAPPTYEADAEGVAVLRGLIATELRLSAAAKVRKEGVGVARARVVPNGQTITMTLPATVKSIGSVILSNGQPAVGARVEVQEADGGFAAIADKNGVAEISTAGDGPFRVEVSWKGSDGAIERAALESFKPGPFVFRLRPID